MGPQYSTVQYNSDELEEIEEIPRMAHTSDNDKPTLNTIIFRAWVKVVPAETFPFPRCVIGSNLAALWGCKIRPYGKPNFSFLLSYPIIIHVAKDTSSTMAHIRTGFRQEELPQWPSTAQAQKQNTEIRKVTNIVTINHKVYCWSTKNPNKNVHL